MLKDKYYCLNIILVRTMFFANYLNKCLYLWGTYGVLTGYLWGTCVNNNPNKRTSYYKGLFLEKILKKLVDYFIRFGAWVVG